MRLRSISAVVLAMAFASAVLSEENQLRDRFQFPDHGKLEVLICPSCTIQGLSLKTDADVLALQRRIEEIPFDEDLITSFEWLKQLGLEKIERPIPPPPPTAKGPVVRFPPWRELTVAFDKDRFIQCEKVMGHEFILAVTPYGEVDVSRGPSYTQANHYASGSHSQKKHWDLGQILSRVDIERSQPYEVEQRDDQEVFSLPQRTKVLGQPGRDLITARLVESGLGTVSHASIQCYHQPPTEENGIWLPRLTCSIYRMPKDRYSIHLFIIRKAELAKPPEDRDFRVPLYQGETYVTKKPTEELGERKRAYRMPMTLTDIADKPPSLVLDLIENEQRNPRP